jgi:septal ring factor EnvC (AmiA/AmiB activator)
VSTMEWVLWGCLIVSEAVAVVFFRRWKKAEASCRDASALRDDVAEQAQEYQTKKEAEVMTLEGRLNDAAERNAELHMTITDLKGEIELLHHKLEQAYSDTARIEHNFDDLTERLEHVKARAAEQHNRLTVLLHEKKKR